MSIAKALPQVDPFFMQPCPLCGTLHRMLIRGNHVDGEKWSRFPDMGYSFCNCKSIFYTKWENITTPIGWNSVKAPLYELGHLLSTMRSGDEHTISMLDPYFIEWKKPHEMRHWECRKIFILWDMDEFVDVCKNIGFEVPLAYRDMDVATSTPQHFHVTVRKP